MSHEILTNESTGESSIVYIGDIPWHGLGFNYTGKKLLTATSASELIGSDYEIEKTQNFCLRPDEEVVAVNRYTLWRPPLAKYAIADWKEIGSVSEDYSLLQTSELAAMLDAKNDDEQAITDFWPIMTHGIISEGTKVFYTLDGGSFGVKEGKRTEEIVRRVSLLDDKTGTGAFVIVVGAIVVVCANTWRQAEGNNDISARIVHKGDIHAEVKDRLDLIREVQQALNRQDKECAAMVGTKVTDADVATLLNKTYPNPAPRKRLEVASRGKSMQDAVARATGSKLAKDLTQYEADRERIEVYRNGVLTEYQKYNDDKGRIGHGTAWAYFNAVTGYVDHEQAVRGNEFSRALYKEFGKGNEAKARAYDACVTVSAKK